MKKIVREPLIHLLLLGVRIFAVNAWRERSRPSGDAAAIGQSLSFENED